MVPPRTSTTLTRALAILNVLGAPEATATDGLGVVDIAGIVGCHKSQVSRTVNTLAEAGYAYRDPHTLRYRLGWRIFSLATSAADQRLLTLAPHVLRQLVAAVGEAAHLSVREGRELLTLLSESPARSIQAAPWVGRVAPLYCTSAGRALLFDHTDSAVRALLEGVEFAADGPNAPRDVDEVLARLHESRKRGYVIVTEEFEAGHVAVAAPVRDFGGRVIAALNISAPKFRLNHSLVAAGEKVEAAAAYVSRVLAAADDDLPGRGSSASNDARRTA